MKNKVNKIKGLLAKNGFPEPNSIYPLPSSGSDRHYYRVEFKNKTINSVLAAYNPDISENIAWNSFSEYFESLGFNVPTIIDRDESYRYFLLNDMGNTSLFYYVSQGIDEKVISYYKYAIRDLLRFQIEGIKGLDLDVAYPVKSLDRRSIMWDLNYFKYYFVKPNAIIFNENKLEDDFEAYTQHLLNSDLNYFMYRDFQSRNIMIHNDELWYIDFQGGRKGPLQYDLVSLLFQARAQLSEELRSDLKSYYLSELEKIIPGKSYSFNKYYNEFIYFRLMQVLGAYGFRGQLQRKTHFLKSIKLAIESLSSQLKIAEPNLDLPELLSVFRQITETSTSNNIVKKPDKLSVSINSFSYIRSGIPDDPTQNGGGFVFDCRALPNPGRIKELRNYSGLQTTVINYLENKPELSEFLENVYGIIDQSISNYIERGFEHLQVNFGCTGGKHRSVFCAEKLADHLKKTNTKIDIRLNHLMADEW